MTRRGPEPRGKPRQRPARAEFEGMFLPRPLPVRCTYRVQVGAAYAPCDGDHPTNLHHDDVARSYVNGLEFAARLVHAEARWQTELALRGAPGAQVAADRMAEVEKAIRSVQTVVQPEGIRAHGNAKPPTKEN